MRMMMRFSIPVERGNEATEAGTIDKLLTKVMNDLKPEAAYFWTEDGERAGMFVFDMKDSSQIAQIAEPLFLGADAAVEFTPVMNIDDLEKGLAKSAR